MGFEGLEIHSKFKFDGQSYDRVGLKELAYDLVKEGTAFERSIGDFLSDWLDDTPTLKVHTSGSTGTPKEIFLKKEYMVNSAQATGKFFNLQAGKTTLLCLPVNYIAGKMMLVRSLVLGLELEYVEPTSIPLSGIEKSFDFVAMIPLQLENSLDELDKIETLIVGGATTSKSLREKVQGKKTAIYETYGMTETITHVAVKRINLVRLSTVETSFTDSPQTTTDHFTALPGVHFFKDERDCLIISAPKVSDDKVITNDIVKLISDKEFEWLGRYDNIINSGGIKLFPEQVELKIAPLLEDRFFVAGLPDEKMGEKLVLIVEGNIDSEDLLRMLKDSSALERFEVPKEIYTLPKFIETDTGKVQRKETLISLNS